MTFYTILCLTNTKVIRKHAKEIIAELTIRTIEDWTPKNRIWRVDRMSDRASERQSRAEVAPLSSVAAVGSERAAARCKRLGAVSAGIADVVPRPVTQTQPLFCVVYTAHSSAMTA